MLTLTRPCEDRTRADSLYDPSVARASVRHSESIEDAFARGDESALKSAYDAHGTLIYNICRKSLPDDRAADVTQEVFVSAWKAHHRFDAAKGSLTAWLVAIAKNRIVDNVRSEGRHESRRADAPTEEIPVEAEVERSADKMLVVEALGLLPSRQRQVIDLAYLGGLTHAEVSDRLQLPLGTVKSDISRGLRRIRTHMGGEA